MGRRSDSISIFNMICQELCWSMHSTDRETEAEGAKLVV